LHGCFPEDMSAQTRSGFEEIVHNLGDGA
jgi:hypothetical protein